MSESNSTDAPSLEGDAHLDRILLDLGADLITLEEVEQSLADGEASFVRWQRSCPPSGLADTIAELKQWAGFHPVKPQALRPVVVPPEPPAPAPEPPAPPPELTSQRIGRNEICPCGSGKKYKKCCGFRHA